MSQAMRLQQLAARSAAVFVLAVVCVFPLYIDKFSNLGVVKFTGGCVLCWAFCLWLGALALVGAKPQPGRLQRCPCLWAAIAIAASGVVSTVFSLAPAASFWGLGGYYGGCMLVLYTFAAYLAVRAFAPQRLAQTLCLGIGLTNVPVTVLYVLNVFDIDLIGTYRDTQLSERGQFFSTLGQMDFCSGFFAVALPLIFYAFLTAYGKKQTFITGILAAFGVLALAVSTADGLTLGLAAALLVLVCTRQFGTRMLRRMAALGSLFFVHAGWLHILRSRLPYNGGTSFLGDLGTYALAGALLCAVLWAVLYFGVKRDLPLFRTGRMFAAVFCAVLAWLVIWANWLPNYPGFGKLDNFLVFGDSWGTGRGLIWQAAAKVWTQLPLWRKLLGVGPGMLHTALENSTGGNLGGLAMFYAAHNEYLELLVTTGLAGLAAWLAFAVLHLRRAAGAWQRPGVAPVTLALVSYLAQAVISIRVSLLFPIVMVLFALLWVFCMPEEPAEPGKGKDKKRTAAAVPAWRAYATDAAAALLAMVLCGTVSRVVLGFLF